MTPVHPNVAARLAEQPELPRPDVSAYYVATAYGPTRRALDAWRAAHSPVAVHQGTPGRIGPRRLSHGRTTGRKVK